MDDKFTSGIKNINFGLYSYNEVSKQCILSTFPSPVKNGSWVRIPRSSYDCRSFLIHVSISTLNLYLQWYASGLFRFQNSEKKRIKNVWKQNYTALHTKPVFHHLMPKNCHLDDTVCKAIAVFSFFLNWLVLIMDVIILMAVHF